MKTQQEQTQEYYEQHEPGELEKLLERLMDDEKEKMEEIYDTERTKDEILLAWLGGLGER